MLPSTSTTSPNPKGSTSTANAHSDAPFTPAASRPSTDDDLMQSLSRLNITQHPRGDILGHDDPEDASSAAGATEGQVVPLSAREKRNYSYVTIEGTPFLTQEAFVLCGYLSLHATKGVNR